MAKVEKQKVANKESPCKAPQPCLDQRDYDPCESGEDITDDDLAMLLKEEQDRLRREREKAEAEQRRQAGKGADGEKGWNDDAKGKGGDGEEEKNRGRPCRRDKRPPCRKRPETNPFFTDRLGFSSDLPPPPPVPPPQFFPPVDGSETKVCPKRRKKCRKGGKKAKEEEEDDGGASLEMKGGLEDEEECACQYEDECKEEGSETGPRRRRKGRCKKRERPPCRKKVSEVSISLQPRKIPALQRDLPPTCPKDIPEVVRQILMACDNECSLDCGKRKCAKPARCK